MHRRDRLTAEKIVYVAVNRSERWSGSEDKVRAEFYAELIYKYGYLRGVAQIRFKKFADLEVKLPEHIRTYYELGE